jgi:TPR repeat protein
MVQYGSHLLRGVGVAPDPTSALAWIERAAGEGSIRAMDLAARCHATGVGTTEDPIMARLWQRRAEAARRKAASSPG